jgi:hypothetical protein
MYAKAAHIYDVIYEVKETDDLSDTYAKLAYTSIKLQNQQKAQYYLELHRKYFSRDHKRSKEIVDQMINSGMEVGL